MLETPFPFFISKKPGEIPIFGIFLAKNSILAYILLKINIFRSVMFYYVIVTSYVDRFSWFWYQGKEKTLFYTMVPNNYTLGMSISKSQGVVITPLRKMCYKKKKKRLRKTRVKSSLSQFISDLTSYIFTIYFSWLEFRVLNVL